MSRLKIKPEYLGYRKNIFETMKLKTKCKIPVYGALIDIKAGDKIVTLACHSSGKTDIYVSSDVGYFKDNKEYESIQKSTISFLKRAEKMLSNFTEVTNYDIDVTVSESVYLFTLSGVYNLKIDEEDDIYEKSSTAFVQFLYKRILASFLHAESYSCMTHKCRKCLFGTFFGGCIIKKIID